jgi:phosphatidylglycerophosphatase A
MNALARLLATLGPIGYAPFAPASVASAVIVAIAYFLPPIPLAVTAALLIVGAFVAVWASTEAEKSLGHDAKPIVIDELIGQSLALLFVPRHPVTYFAAFFLFRLFDVWKPLGAREVQRLPGGQGVVADDAIAGVTACAVLHGLMWAARAAGIAVPV